MSQFLTEKRRSGNAGYFRIGDVTLTIPPEEIVTNKVVNNQELSPLRSRYSLFQKTGFSRWDVTISWKALVGVDPNDGVTSDYSEFRSLQRILAMFVAAPFVEIENAHLRQFVAENDPGFLDGDRMSFAMRQLRVDTLGDLIDGLQVTLTMSLFNAKPYSTEFAYKGTDEGEKVSADQSMEFSDYLDRWIAANLDNPRILKSYPALAPWANQTPGSLTFKWREYGAFPKKQPAASEYPQSTAKGIAPNGMQATLPRTSGRKRMNASEPPAHIKAIIVEAAGRANINANLALAVAQRESGFRPDAVNQQLNKDGVRLSDATGLFQLTGQTQKQWKVTNPTDPVQNARAGTAYIAQFLRKYKGDTVAALTAFAAGEGYVQKLGVAGTWAYNGPSLVNHQFQGKNVNLTWVPGWIADITNIANQFSKGSFSLTPPAVATQASPFNPATAQIAVDHSLTPEEVLAFADAGWLVDHETNSVAFLYRPYAMTLTDEEHGDAPDSGGTRLYPTQFSIMFVNTLAALPLEAYSIATYQHIGAASTRISINMLSDGLMTQDGEGNAIEPVHPGLSALAGTVSLLENQFHAMKTQWRSVSSIHRMQAIVIEHQILNMLGIFAVIPESLQTSTLPDSPSLLQASLHCAQYENVFEQLSPYQVKGVGAYDDIWQKEVFDNSSDFQQAVNTNPLLAPLQTIAKQMQNRDLQALYGYLAANPTLPAVPTNVPISADDQRTLIRALPEITKTNSALGSRIAKDSSLNFNDVLALCLGTPGLNRTWFTDYMKKVDQVAKTGPDPVTQLFKVYVAFSVANNRSLSSAVSQLEASTQFAKKLNAAVDPNGPGSSEANLDHVAYRDLGLYNLDDQPASYFYDDARRLDPADAGEPGGARGHFDGRDHQVSSIRRRPATPPRCRPTIRALTPYQGFAGAKDHAQRNPEARDSFRTDRCAVPFPLSSCF
jgi:hypothetical protein